MRLVAGRTGVRAVGNLCITKGCAEPNSDARNSLKTRRFDWIE